MPLDPHTGSNMVDIQSQLALQVEFSCKMFVLYYVLNHALLATVQVIELKTGFTVCKNNMI